jgi:hypothetical protein
MRVALRLVVIAALGAALWLFWSRTDPAKRSRAAAAARRAESMVLYEGLPHQTWERELLERELRSKRVVRRGDFPFYAEPLPLTAADAIRLTDLFCNPHSFRKWAGPKTCGAFHPDYCLEWRAGKETYQCLLCFGCHEAKVFGPNTALYFDISQAAYKQFTAILRPYRKNRPQPE